VLDSCILIGSVVIFSTTSGLAWPKVVYLNSSRRALSIDGIFNQNGQDLEKSIAVAVFSFKYRYSI
jgi:hypothetical protein